MDTPSANSAIDRASEIFRENGGILKMAAAIENGIHRNTLKKMVQNGVAEKVSRGLYQLVDMESPYPDLAIVAVKIPDGVVCLISALALHEITTQIPHEIHIAIERDSKPPRIDYPPIQAYQFSGQAFTAGVETHNVGPRDINVYCREKTIADCFKYRNKIGLDTCVEALKLYKQQQRIDAEAIFRYAKICRVDSVMRPYAESIL